MEYYFLGKNHASGTLLSLNLLDVKIHTSGKISKFCQHFRGTKTNMGKRFGISIFLLEKTKLYRYYQNKRQFAVTSSLYINLIMKLLMKL